MTSPKSLLLMLIHDVFPLIHLTYFHFSRVGKPILDTAPSGSKNLLHIGLFLHSLSPADYVVAIHKL